MTRRTIRGVMWIAVAVLPALAWPNSAQAQQGPRVVSMRVHPAAEPSPALKYTLLPELIDREKGDAVPLYYIAMEQIQEPEDDAGRSLSEQVGDWLGLSVEALPREEVRAVLDRNRRALQYVELAAVRETAQWETAIRVEGVNALLPSLSRYRTLAKLLALRARLEIAEGRFDDAIGSVRLGYSMAKQVGESNATLIGALVGAAVADLMTDQLVLLVQQPGAPNLYWALACLPRPVVDFRDGWEAEKSIVLFSVPKLAAFARGERLSADELRTLMSDVSALVLSGGVGHPEGQKQAWNERVAAAAFAVVQYPRAKQYLRGRGFSEAEVEAMPVQEVVLRYQFDSYLTLRDNVFKCMGLPFWQANERVRAAETQIAAEAARNPGGLPFLNLLPSLSRARFIEARCTRHVAMVQAVEALRIYAASHDGKMPASLDELGPIPVPINPVTGRAFDYRLENDVATLEQTALPGQEPREGIRYEITMLRE
jgi:hypothetical protein